MITAERGIALKSWHEGKGVELGVGVFACCFRKPSIRSRSS